MPVLFCLALSMVGISPCSPILTESVKKLLAPTKISIGYHIHDDPITCTSLLNPSSKIHCCGL